MLTRYTHGTIWNLGLAVLLGPFVISMVPSDAAAQKGMSEQRCLTELRETIVRLGIRPDQKTYARAQRHCAKGNLTRAVKVVRKKKGKEVHKTMSEEDCLTQLKGTIRKMGISPDQETYAKAQRYCAKGDFKSAVNVLREEGSAQAGEGTSEEQCLTDLKSAIKRMGIRPDARTYARAQRYCASGDLRGAINVVRGGR